MLVPLIVGSVSMGQGRKRLCNLCRGVSGRRREITSVALQLRSLLVADSLSHVCSSFRLLSLSAYSIMIRPPLVTFTCHMQLSSHLPLDSSHHQMTHWKVSSWKNTQFWIQKRPSKRGKMEKSNQNFPAHALKSHSCLLLSSQCFL